MRSKSNGDRPSMGLESFDGRQTHDGRTDALEAIEGQTGAGDVFDVRRQVDAGILSCVTVGGYYFFPRLVGCIDLI